MAIGWPSAHINLRIVQHVKAPRGRHGARPPQGQASGLRNGGSAPGRRAGVSLAIVASPKSPAAAPRPAHDEGRRPGAGVPRCRGLGERVGSFGGRLAITSSKKTAGRALPTPTGCAQPLMAPSIFLRRTGGRVTRLWIDSAWREICFSNSSLVAATVSKAQGRPMSAHRNVLGTGQTSVGGVVKGSTLKTLKTSVKSPHPPPRGSRPPRPRPPRPPSPSPLPARWPPLGPG